jgi:glycerophosphoryl diester phosphodiesterase
MPGFELQGHRGARGLVPENTLSSLEVALDLGVSAIETDLHLTADGHAVLFHDPRVSQAICRFLPGQQAAETGGEEPLVGSLTLRQLRAFAFDINPHPERFPTQDGTPRPLATLFAERKGFHPYAMPAVEDVFQFLQAYVGPMGTFAGKTPAQQANVNRVILDFELKRVPFRPEYLGAGLEKALVDVIRRAGALGRCRVRSFDHRCLRTIGELSPEIKTAVLVGEGAPVHPAELVRQAEAQFYCPFYAFVDQDIIQQVHDAGYRIIPWTVNEVEDCVRLAEWGVDGITTDYPDRIGEALRARGILN